MFGKKFCPFAAAAAIIAALGILILGYDLIAEFFYSQHKLGFISFILALIGVVTL